MVLLLSTESWVVRHQSTAAWGSLAVAEVPQSQAQAAEQQLAGLRRCAPLASSRATPGTGRLRVGLSRRRSLRGFAQDTPEQTPLRP